MGNDEHPRPGKSKIVFQIVEGGSHYFFEYGPGGQKQLDLEFYEIQSKGGSAAIEAEAGMLEDAIAGLLDPEHKKVGWWVMEGFYGHFTRGDGWETDDDCDYECDLIRPATWRDMDEMGLPVSLRKRIMILMGWDAPVPPKFGAPT